jgi:hypothetical protein
VARQKYTLQKAYDHVDGARRGLRINDGFLRALMSWELDRNPNLRQSTLKRYARGGKGMADSEANATGTVGTQALVAVTDE